ncbi:hypothetical protein ID866_5932 [Astraeus odoratus]|nr:hypothetical protein ID866_5932 [Astraeus odoratus]
MNAQRPLLVGVFQNQPLQEVLSIVSSVQLDLVQLHGREPLEWSKHIPVPVVRAFHVSANGGGLEDLTRPGLHHYVLLDSQRASDGLSGGSGMVVDWDLAARVVAAGELRALREPAGKSDGEPDSAAVRPDGNAGDPPHLKASMPIILAGGLTAENVAEAVTKVRPWAVDVSGDVETSDRKGKDLARVSAFIRAAKEAGTA